jgi:hypothetical protein
MSDATLEKRVADLEMKVASLMGDIPAPVSQSTWRTAIGMFTGDSLMREIDDEGRKIREADREQAKRDHS